MQKEGGNNEETTGIKKISRFKCEEVGQWQFHVRKMSGLRSTTGGVPRGVPRLEEFWPERREYPSR